MSNLTLHGVPIHVSVSHLPTKQLLALDQPSSETCGVVSWCVHLSVSPCSLLQPLRKLCCPCLGLAALKTTRCPLLPLGDLQRFYLSITLSPHSVPSIMHFLQSSPEKSPAPGSHSCPHMKVASSIVSGVTGGSDRWPCQLSESVVCGPYKVLDKLVPVLSVLSSSTKQ